MQHGMAFVKCAPTGVINRPMSLVGKGDSSEDEARLRQMFLGLYYVTLWRRDRTPAVSALTALNLRQFHAHVPTDAVDSIAA
jgi:LPS sulfotransferase NodH